MYKTIVNPVTNRRVSIYGKIGQKVLNNYINSLTGGSDRTFYRFAEPIIPLEKRKGSFEAASGKRGEQLKIQEINNIITRFKENTTGYDDSALGIDFFKYAIFIGEFQFDDKDEKCGGKLILSLYNPEILNETKYYKNPRTLENKTKEEQEAIFQKNINYYSKNFELHCNEKKPFWDLEPLSEEEVNVILLLSKNESGQYTGLNDVIRDVIINRKRIEFTYQRPNDWQTPGRDPYNDQKSVTIELTKTPSGEINDEVIYESKQQQVKEEQMEEEWAAQAATATDPPTTKNLLKNEILGLIFPPEQGQNNVETILNAIDA